MCVQQHAFVFLWALRQTTIYTLKDIQYQFEKNVLFRKTEAHTLNNSHHRLRNVSGGLSMNQVPDRKKREMLGLRFVILSVFFFLFLEIELRDDLIKSVEMTNSIMSAEDRERIQWGENEKKSLEIRFMEMEYIYKEQSRKKRWMKEGDEKRDTCHLQPHTFTIWCLSLLLNVVRHKNNTLF